MRLMLVHGRGQGDKDPRDLEQEWLEALMRGYNRIKRPFPDHISVDFPFYGRVLADHVKAADLPLSEQLRSKGGPADQGYEEFLAQTLMEMMGSDSRISDSAVEAELPSGAAREKGPQNWPWVIAIARAIDKHVTGAADFTIERFLRDVYLYLNRRPAKRDIDQIVRDRLTGEPTVVVAHSLGSLVAYNVLREAADANVVKFVTVGSPLGIRSIGARLGIPSNPFGTSAWFNAFDARDIVALNPLTVPNFPTDPAILNFEGVQNHTRNRHGIVGYLDDPEA